MSLFSDVHLIAVESHRTNELLEKIADTNALGVAALQSIDVWLQRFYELATHDPTQDVIGISAGFTKPTPRSPEGKES